ncbi:MAG: DUF3198 domain-containing protein [Thermoplasmata archaeon]
MAEGDPPPEWGSRLRETLRTHRYIFSLIVFAIGILLCVLALGDLLSPLSGSPPFNAINPLTDGTLNGGTGANYNLAFAIIGPIVFIVGAYLTGAYILARRKFEHLMLTKSKAEFLRNIPDLEQILWDLTPADEDRYFQRRVELKIRR